MLAKLISEDGALYLSKWKENAILSGYYKYIDQAYRKLPSAYLEYYSDYSPFRQEVMIPLMGENILEQWQAHFNVLDKIPENIEVLWERVLFENPDIENYKTMAMVNDVLSACFYFYKTDYRTVLRYLQVFETRVQSEKERGAFYTYRIRMAKYYGDIENAYQLTEKLFSKPEYLTDLSDVEHRQIEYFLAAIDLKKDYLAVFRNMIDIAFNQSEEFLFCKDLLFIFRLEFAFDLQQLDSLEDELVYLEEKWEFNQRWHLDLSKKYEEESAKISLQLFAVILGYLKANYISLKITDITKFKDNFFNAIDFKKLVQNYESENFRLFSYLHIDLEHFVEKMIKTYAQKISSDDLKKAVVTIVTKLLQVELETHEIQHALAKGTRLLRQHNFIKSFKNYLTLRRLLLKHYQDKEVSLKEVQTALNQKIFPGQTDQAYAWLYADYVHLLVINSHFEPAYKLFHQAENNVQKLILQKFETSREPTHILFLFHHYYKKNFTQAEKYIPFLSQYEPSWKTNFTFLQYLNRKTLEISQLKEVLDWLNAEEVPMAPLMFYVLQKNSKEELAQFLESFIPQINEQIQTLEISNDLTQKINRPVTNMDILHEMYMRDQDLQSQMPKWEEMSQEQQLFVSQTKAQMPIGKFVWELGKLSAEHPFCKFIKRVEGEVKKNNGQTTIEFVFQYGDRKINVSYNSYNQIIIEENGHSHQESYEAVCSLIHTLFNNRWLPALKGLDLAQKKIEKQKLYRSTFYDANYKKKLFEEYQNLSRIPFELIYEEGQNPFEADYFSQENIGGVIHYRPQKDVQGKRFQIRWVDPYLRSLPEITDNDPIKKKKQKNKQLDLYVQYQIREMIRNQHPLFVSGKIKTTDDYLNALESKKIEDPKLRFDEATCEFEFPEKSVYRLDENKKSVLMKRPTTHISGFFQVYPVTE